MGKKKGLFYKSCEMREKAVRESASERVSERGERFLQGGSVWDRVGCTSQSGDSRITVESSFGRFGSDFRLVASRNASSHFVFLELSQLRWLEGVLLTAKSSNWHLPKSCFASSVRRRVEALKFNLKGVSMLKVSEICPSGQVFFVLIPADSKSGGWMSFLRTIQDILDIKPSKSLAIPTRSFAEVVAGPSFPLSGRCSKSNIEGEGSILVEDVGIKDRQVFLSKCLVMRFVGSQPLRWDEFRKWSSSSWGIPVASSFLPLGDDLWMLVCSSVSEVERILALKRWRFKDWDIFMDVWTKAAGRSRVLEDSNTAWVVVRGIPLHLRSMELFRQIGDYCGGFISAEDGVSLSSIRLKVTGGSLIPDELPIRHGSEIFPVRIEAEAPSPLSAHGNLSSFLSKWKAKGKFFKVGSAGSGGVSSSALPISPMVKGSSSSAARSAEIGGAPPRVGRQDSQGTCNFRGDSAHRVLLSPRFDGQLSEDLTSEVDVASNVPSVGFNSNQIVPLVSQAPEASDPYVSFTVFYPSTTGTVGGSGGTPSLETPGVVVRRRGRRRSNRKFRQVNGGGRGRRREDKKADLYLDGLELGSSHK
ncbi:hypothetical protein LINPERHAP2_LOCUS30993 [Linum perenne]